MLRVLVILASTILVVSAARAEEPKPKPNPVPSQAANSPAASETESQQFARARMLEMAKFLGQNDRFTVSIKIGYDVLQANGQKIEFGEVRELAVQRPNRARILETAGHKGRDMMLFDGKFITMFNGETGYYAKAPQPGDIDATVVNFVRDLQMRLPLAPMLMTTFDQELQRRVQRVDYVELTDVLGVPAHHIAARTANVDFQVWIADNEKRPLPLRIVLTYPSAEGQPQFRADFSKWNLSPRFNKATFEFKPPANAKQIPFAAQVLPLSTQPQPAVDGSEGVQP